MNAHGQQYEVLQSLAAEEHNRTRHADNARINIPPNEGLDAELPRLRSVVWYFFLCFPMPIVTDILKWTNRNIQASGYVPYLKTELTKGEFFQHLGIRLCMIITPLRGGIDAYFATYMESGTVYEPGNYGRRFGMSKNRFKLIQECYAFAPPAAPGNDPWWQIRPIIDSFNDRMRKVVIPGTFLCIDECMSMWKGLCWKIAGIFGLPHKTKIARKPEGVGCEFKSLACVQTGIILALDIMEGSARNAAKQFNNLGAGIGTCLRMTAPWHGSRRVLVGDSWFASVLTAYYLWTYGLFFMGIVKTASKFFPKQYLVDWCNLNYSRPNRGNHILLKTVKEGVNIYALGWSDKKGKQVVFTTGTTIAADPSIRRRHKRVLRDGIWEKEAYHKEVKRPMIIKEMFDAFSTIDIHDHLRQGSLELEREWVTRNWVHRLFMTILGMIIVNAFNAYLYMTTDSEPIDFNVFLGKLAYELIFNKFRNEDNRQLRQRQVNTPSPIAGGDGGPHVHHAARLSDRLEYAHLKGTGNRARRCCKACKTKTAWYCVQCTDRVGTLVCYCYGNTDKNCFSLHDH